MGLFTKHSSDENMKDPKCEDRACCIKNAEKSGPRQEFFQCKTLIKNRAERCPICCGPFLEVIKAISRWTQKLCVQV